MEKPPSSLPPGQFWFDHKSIPYLLIWFRKLVQWKVFVSMFHSLILFLFGVVHKIQQHFKTVSAKHTILHWEIPISKLPRLLRKWLWYIHACCNIHIKTKSTRIQPLIIIIIIIKKSSKCVRIDVNYNVVLWFAYVWCRMVYTIFWQISTLVLGLFSGLTFSSLQVNCGFLVIRLMRINKEMTLVQFAIYYMRWYI